MSSFRIIKSAQNDGSGISEFNFRLFGQVPSIASPTQGAAGFVPMGIYTGLDLQRQNEPQSEELEDVGPPLVEMSEEELAQKISDSFNSGLQEGKNLTERGLVNVFRSLRGASETVRNLREKVLRESEDELINLVMLVARKVIHREISQDRCILAEVVKNAISGLSAREEVIVRINPDDYALVISGREECLQKELLSEHLQLKADPMVAAGFCQVDTDMGTIDAGLNAQLEAVYRSLLEERTLSSSNNE